MSSGHWKKLQAIADAEVATIWKSLPQKLHEQVEKLPITYQPRPNESLVSEGVEPDTLGLFVGPEFAEEGMAPMPAQIILFLENILDLADGDEEIFRQEIRTTLLHELGHYLGLDEDELTERGLE